MNNYSHQSVRTEIALENKGIFECGYILIYFNNENEMFTNREWKMAWGRARTYRASKYFNYEKHAAKQPIGWVLSSIGHC